MLDNLLLILFLISFLFEFAVYFIGRTIGKQVSWLVFLTFLGISLVYVSFFPTVMHEGILEEYSWVSTPINLTFGLLADGLSVPIIFTYMFVFAFATLYSRPYMEKRFSLDDIEENNEQYARFYTFFLLYAASVAGAMLSTNLIEFYLFFEMGLVFSWLMVLLFGYGDRERNSLLYFLYTHVGGGLLLIGIIHQDALLNL